MLSETIGRANLNKNGFSFHSLGDYLRCQSFRSMQKLNQNIPMSMYGHSNTELITICIIKITWQIMCQLLNSEKHLLHQNILSFSEN